MQLSQLAAQSFRNLSRAPVFFGSGVTLVVGDNAQGKTSLLEAVAVLCGQRSFRRAKPSEMACGGENFSITGTFVGGGVTEELSVQWQRSVGRRFHRGTQTISFREASGLAPAVFLAPEDKEILVGAPALRRRFLDRLVVGLRPAAAEDIMRYERVLASRNALLGHVRSGPSAADELETWTDELAVLGAKVRRHRQEALEVWLPHFALLARDAGPAYVNVQVVYQARENSEQGLREAFARLARAEQGRGHTLAGPHRDDLVWTRDNLPLSVTASAGELHRTIILVRLAEWHAIAKAAGAAPLFAVDEFDAGLSTAWVEAFLQALPPAPTVLLTTVSDPSRWSRLADHVLEVRGGCVTGRPLAVSDTRRTMP